MGWWTIKKTHNISRPGEEPTNGDIVEIECVGGFVCEVDPKTRQSTATHQRFKLGDDGALAPVRRGED